MMSTAPILTVVLPTYNRRDVLPGTLQRLAEQTVSPDQFEVLVVDDGSTDGTSEAIRESAVSWPYRLRCLRHENRGPGYTENRGIREARTPLVLILADDVRAVPGLIEEHLSTHAVNPADHFAVLGKVVQCPDLPDTVLHRRWDRYQIPFQEIAGQTEVAPIFFFACNVSVKRQFLLEHGMFLERKGAANEDIELGYRLGLSGLRILYNEKALGYHHHETDLEDACARSQEQGYNIDLLLENVPASIILPECGIASPEAGWRIFASMLPRAILRGAVFNRWLVEGVLYPVLRAAEHSRLAALFAHQRNYDSVAGYFVRKGYREMRRERGHRAVGAAR